MTSTRHIGVTGDWGPSSKLDHSALGLRGHGWRWWGRAGQRFAIVAGQRCGVGSGAKGWPIVDCSVISIIDKLLDFLLLPWDLGCLLGRGKSRFDQSQQAYTFIEQINRMLENVPQRKHTTSGSTTTYALLGWVPNGDDESWGDKENLGGYLHRPWRWRPCDWTWLTILSWIFFLKMLSEKKRKEKVGRIDSLRSDRNFDCSLSRLVFLRKDFCRYLSSLQTVGRFFFSQFEFGLSFFVMLFELGRWRALRSTFFESREDSRLNSW